MAFSRIAPYYATPMYNEVRTLAKTTSRTQYCELDVMAGEFNRFTLTGCLAKHEEPLSLAFTIQDGVSYSGIMVKNELLHSNIQLKRQPRHQPPY